MKDQIYTSPEGKILKDQETQTRGSSTAESSQSSNEEGKGQELSQEQERIQGQEVNHERAQEYLEALDQSSEYNTYANVNIPEIAESIYYSSNPEVSLNQELHEFIASGNQENVLQLLEDLYSMPNFTESGEPQRLFEYGLEQARQYGTQELQSFLCQCYDLSE